MASDTVTTLQARIDSLRACCLSNVPDDLRVVSVARWEQEDADEPNEAALFVAWSADFPALRFAVLEGWEDYTGHGCRCGSAISFHDTPEDACRLGLSDKGRELLRLDVDGNETKRGSDGEP